MPQILDLPNNIVIQVESVQVEVGLQIGNIEETIILELESLV